MTQAEINGYLVSGSWFVAIVVTLFALVKVYRTRSAKPLVAAYLAIGFFGFALPFKIMMPVTSLFAMLLFTFLWPAWLVQGWLGVAPDVYPIWFLKLLFTFPEVPA
jgi:hypothetical protein